MFKNFGVNLGSLGAKAKLLAKEFSDCLVGTSGYYLRTVLFTNMQLVTLVFKYRF